jgi:predicted O-linked N-acetylglucosamine transferase (SPINDLY family)
LRAGRPQAAAALLESYLRSEHTDAQGWFLLGACRHALNDLPGATAAFARSLSLDPENAEAHLAYISVLRAAHQAQSALAASQQALARFSRDARMPYAAALCLEDLGKSDSALAHYDAALQIAPGFEDALHNKALLLSRLGKLEEAAALHRRRVQAFPASAPAHSGLADSLLALGQFKEAMKVLDTLERLAPFDVSARVRQGVALASLRRFDEASAAFSDARKRDARAVAQYVQRVSPGSDPDLMLSPENVFLGRTWAALGQCDWSSWEGFVAEMGRAAREPRVVVEPAVAFMCQHAPLAGPERHAIARKIAAAVEAKVSVLPPAPTPGTAPIRIGILSADFREHLDAYETLPLLQLINRSRFQVSAYSLAPDDGSAIRARVASAANTFVDLHALDDHSAALKIRGDDIDILVDLTGHKTGGRFGIMARRPARLQASYRGFSNALGSRRVDYAIVDRIIGGGDAEWTEARVFLPGTYYLHDYRKDAPAARPTRIEYGLPEDAFVYCAFHKAEKISPDAFDLWMRILSAVPRSVLWLRAPPDAAMRRLRDAAHQRGIDPTRLVFAQFEPRHDPRYFARHRLGDLMLDALHHNAIESACDALGEGLPLLTLQGSALASRAGESLVRAAGLAELVMRDREDYVRAAVKFGTDRAALSDLKQRLAANRRTAPLFDTAGRVRALETAFQKMYDRMLRGEPPASFDV